MDGLGADNPEKVCSEERKKEVVCCSTHCGNLLHPLHRHKHLGLKEVGDGDGRVGEDDGEARPEESVHKDGVEGGEREQGGNHCCDASEGQVGSPPYHPSRAWKMSFYFVFLCIFVITFVVVVVVVSIASQLVGLLIGRRFCSQQVFDQIGPEGVSQEGKGRDVSRKEETMQAW